MAERKRMRQPPYFLGEIRRQTVLAAIQDKCAYESWKLFAAHIRTNHVHIVVESDIHPERIMNALKSYASRRLNDSGFEAPDRKRWARHGSTRWLWTQHSISAAIRYVVDDQGSAMAVFESLDA